MFNCCLSCGFYGKIDKSPENRGGKGKINRTVKG
jgi:hypothetical protein